MPRRSPYHPSTRSSDATIAIVGRPNVGKSTLFNRLVGRRRALVGDEPGITRDRLYGRGHWSGRDFRVIDTGGILPHDKEHVIAEVFRQARVALAEAGAIVMVVDGRSELTGPDRELAQLLLRSGKPLFLAVNKVDDPKLEAQAQQFHELGIQNLFAVSAEHGTGVAELLDAVLEVLPEKLTAEPAESAEELPQAEEIRIAIIGRPNVGKSTLLNRLAGAERAIVSPVPGTTRDAVDEVVEHEGARFRFIDTAGMRRKGKTRLAAEKLSVMMARKHLGSADIALVMIDAGEGPTERDANIAGYAHQAGRSLILLVNKWDLRRPSERGPFERQVRNALKFLDYAPLLFISAARGKNVEKVLPLIQQVAAERRKRIPTGEMNRFLSRVDLERAPAPAAKRVRVYYMTQAGTAPPTFVLFTDRAVKMHFSFQRYLENQIRRAFGFAGTPIRFVVKAHSGRSSNRT